MDKQRPFILKWDGGLTITLPNPDLFNEGTTVEVKSTGGSLFFIVAIDEERSRLPEIKKLRWNLMGN